MDTANTEALDRADMARLVGGHDAALNDLMDRHAPAVFRFLCRMLGNEDDANDLAQDTFVRVYRARESYKPEQKFSTWLFTIAGNLARNQFRWRSRHPNVSLDAESETTEQTLGDTLQSSMASPHQAAVATERAEAVRAVESLHGAGSPCRDTPILVLTANALVDDRERAIDAVADFGPCRACSVEPLILH